MREDVGGEADEGAPVDTFFPAQTGENEDGGPAAAVSDLREAD